MSNETAKPDPLERACSLVGRFLYHFGRLEQKIDQAVIKLSDLDEKVAPIVAKIDFARKVDLVRSSAYEQVKNAKEKEFAKDTCSGVHKANWYRRTIAHSSFEVAPGGGVQFIKIFNKDGIVRPVDPPWTETDFANRYAEMTALETELDKLIELIKPAPLGWYVPDWDVPWQREMYRGTPLALRIAAMNEQVEVP
jgi:hypothetical protein